MHRWDSTVAHRTWPPQSEKKTNSSRWHGPSAFFLSFFPRRQLRPEVALQRHCSSQEIGGRSHFFQARVPQCPRTPHSSSPRDERGDPFFLAKKKERIQTPRQCPECGLAMENLAPDRSARHRAACPAGRSITKIKRKNNLPGITNNFQIHFILGISEKFICFI